MILIRLALTRCALFKTIWPGTEKSTSNSSSSSSSSLLRLDLFKEETGIPLEWKTTGSSTFCVDRRNNELGEDGTVGNDGGGDDLGGGALGDNDRGGEAAEWISGLSWVSGFSWVSGTALIIATLRGGRFDEEALDDEALDEALVISNFDGKGGVASGAVCVVVYVFVYGFTYPLRVLTRCQGRRLSHCVWDEKV